MAVSQVDVSIYRERLGELTPIVDRGVTTYARDCVATSCKYSGIAYERRMQYSFQHMCMDGLGIFIAHFLEYKAALHRSLVICDEGSNSW